MEAFLWLFRKTMVFASKIHECDGLLFKEACDILILLFYAVICQQV